MTSGAASPYHPRLAAGGWRKLDLVEEVPGGSADALRRYFFNFALLAQEARHRHRTPTR